MVLGGRSIAQLYSWCRSRDKALTLVKMVPRSWLTEGRQITGLREWAWQNIPQSKIWPLVHSPWRLCLLNQVNLKRRGVWGDRMFRKDSWWCFVTVTDRGLDLQCAQWRMWLYRAWSAEGRALSLCAQWSASYPWTQNLLHSPETQLDHGCYCPLWLGFSEGVWRRLG